MKERLERISNNEALQEEFLNMLADQMATDDEVPRKKWARLRTVYEQHPDVVDDLLMTLCGWTFGTLVAKTLAKRQDGEEEWSDLRDALAYVREQLNDDRVAVIRAQANVCYNEHRPIETDYDDEVYDLLEEWGEDNDYGEEWWSPHCEFCDIIVKI